MSEVESLASSLAELELQSNDLQNHPQSLHESLQDSLNKAQAVGSKGKSGNLLENQEKNNTSNKEPSRTSRSSESNTSFKSEKSLKLIPSATSSRYTKRVPQSERRGLLSSITILPEYRDPRTYSPKLKLLIVLIVAFAAVAGPMGTTILLPAVTDLTLKLNTTVSMVNISVGIYSLSLGIFPMWWSNFSEKHGRRSVYVMSFLWFFAFSIACAVAPSIGSLIVLRLLAGAGASAIQSCGAGTISDLYAPEERGTALGLFYLGPLFGPFLAPIVGGAVAQAWGWRATMWVMTIVCGVNVLLIIFLLPETLPSDNSEIMQMLAKDATTEKDDDAALQPDLERTATMRSQTSSLRRQRLEDEAPVDLIVPTLLRISTNQSSYSRHFKDQQLDADSVNSPTPFSWKTYVYDYVVRPVHAVVLLGYLPILPAIVYSGIAFMGIYFLNISIANLYARPPYNFSPIVVGLMYIPNSVTFILASIYGGQWNDWLIKRHARLHNGELQPEARLSWNIVLAAAIFPPASMIFAWCLDKKQHWVTPLIGSALFGLALMLVMGTTLTYLVDLLPGKGATGVAINNLVRQVLAATATFITEPITSAVGTGVLFSIYTGVISVGVLSVWYLKRNGPEMRQKYDLSKFYAKL